MQDEHGQPAQGVNAAKLVAPHRPHRRRGKDLAVEIELVGIERDRREDRVLREEVVGDDALREEIELPQLLLLAVALEQEEELGLEGMSFGVLVEFPQEGILLDLLEEEPRPELRGEPSCEGRLPVMSARIFELPVRIASSSARDFPSRASCRYPW